MNYQAVAKRVSDPKMQEFLSIIGGAAPDVEKLKNVARDERPFLPELAWAYFTAYTTILYGTHLRFMALRSGFDQHEPEEFFTYDEVRKILKAVLPHQSKFIDENEPERYHYLLDEIEVYLLIELRKILKGKDVDQAATVRAKEIMDAINRTNEERAKKAVADWPELISGGC